MKIYRADGLVKRAPESVLLVTFANSVADSPGATVNNYSPSGFIATTNRLLVTAFAGGTTVSGISSATRSDGDVIALFNDSDTDNLVLSNNSGLSLAGNRFLGPGATDVAIVPRQGLLLVLVNGFWRFV